MNATRRGAFRLVPMGDRCLIVSFEARVDPAINARVRAVADALLEHPIDGVVDVVPAFTTVAIHYQPEALAMADSTELPHRRLAAIVEERLLHDVVRAERASRVVEIPVCYGGEFGPDLDEVAALCGLAPDDVIERHAASPHRVYMLGFAPGFPYLGGLDPSLEAPRRATPRTKVPAGSVAIARDQSCIYALETPGGWNVIGRTPVRLFAPDDDPPCLLAAGDDVRFVPISREAYEAERARRT
jgi:inhibitor of KinA